MDLREFEKYSPLRKAFVKAFDPGKDHIQTEMGNVTIVGVYVLECGSSSVFGLPTEETGRGKTFTSSQGVQLSNIRGDMDAARGFDSFREWGESRPGVANRLDREALQRVADGETTLYYVGRGTSMPKQIWQQLKGEGSVVTRVFPPSSVVAVEWLDTAEEDGLDALKERVATEYQERFSDAVVVSR